MKILVGVSHPKHVLIFKNVIANLMERDHEVKIVAVEKEITEYLLNRFNMPHTLIGKNQPTLYRKLLVLPKWEHLTYKISKEFKPDIFVGRALPHLAHVSAILNKPFIIFEDTENVKKLHKITLPFANAVATPDCYRENLGKKHIRFNGYFELGYLHPNYFKPDPDVLEEIGLSKGDRYIIVRFVAWRATHDVGQRGFVNGQEIIEELEDYGCVFITSERKLSKAFEKYSMNVPPEKMHDLLYYATMYIGEGAAMASESAVLGTPAIYVNTLRLGYLDEQEKKYGLVYNFSNPKTAQKDALAKAVELLEDGNLKNKWQRKREKLLNEKIDVTKFMTDFIVNYPESFEKWKVNNPKEMRL